MSAEALAATSSPHVRIRQTLVEPSRISGAVKAKPAIGYARVSTARQGRSGLGLEAQRQAIEAFAASHGFEIAGFEIEIETGKGADALDRRPKLRAALERAKRLKAPILIAKLDRLSPPVPM
jgi:DNA invertase Pin-like site-specific DNA recombinase